MFAGHVSEHAISTSTHTRHFSFDEKIWFDVWKFPAVRLEQHFPEFSEKKTTLREGFVKFSEISYSEFLFHFTFLSEFPEFSVQWFEF